MHLSGLQTPLSLHGMPVLSSGDFLSGILSGWHLGQILLRLPGNGLV